MKPADLEVGIESPIDDLRYSGDNEVELKYPIMQNPHTRLLNQLLAPSHAEIGLGVPKHMMEEAVSEAVEDVADYIKTGKFNDAADWVHLRDEMPSVKSRRGEYWWHSKTDPIYARQMLLAARAAMEVFNNAQWSYREGKNGYKTNNESRVDERATRGDAPATRPQQGRDAGMENGTRGSRGKGIISPLSDIQWFNEAITELQDEYIKGEHYVKLLGGNHPIKEEDMPADDIRMATDPAGWLEGKYEEKIKFSAENPGYTNNKDTHKSQDMRQVNRWAVERLCDRFSIMPFMPPTNRK